MSFEEVAHKPGIFAETGVLIEVRLPNRTSNASTQLERAPVHIGVEIKINGVLVISRQEQHSATIPYQGNHTL